MLIFGGYSASGVATLDALNQRYGRGTVKLTSAGLVTDRRAWTVKQERRTPGYTTCWVDIPVVRGRPAVPVFGKASRMQNAATSRHPPLPCLCAKQRAAVATASQFKPVYFLHLGDQNRQVMRMR